MKDKKQQQQCCLTCAQLPSSDSDFWMKHKENEKGHLWENLSPGMRPSFCYLELSLIAVLLHLKLLNLCDILINLELTATSFEDMVKVAWLLLLGRFVMG